jgi:hypothetical protein
MYFLYNLSVSDQIYRETVVMTGLVPVTHVDPPPRLPETKCAAA